MFHLRCASVGGKVVVCWCILVVKEETWVESPAATWARGGGPHLSGCPF